MPLKLPRAVRFAGVRGSIQVLHTFTERETPKNLNMLVASQGRPLGKIAQIVKEKQSLSRFPIMDQSVKAISAKKSAIPAIPREWLRRQRADHHEIPD